MAQVAGDRAGAVDAGADRDQLISCTCSCGRPRRSSPRTTMTSTRRCSCTCRWCRSSSGEGPTRALAARGLRATTFRGLPPRAHAVTNIFGAAWGRCSCCCGTWSASTDPVVPSVIRAAHAERLRNVAFFQLLQVALPGSSSSAAACRPAHCAFRGRIRVLGAPVGWGLVIANALFAVAHPTQMGPQLAGAGGASTPWAALRLDARSRTSWPRS